MSATELLTAVLVLVTGYYAWQNRRMVQEMAAARSVAVLPKLVLQWTMVSPVLAFPTVKNVGPGPALDVDISIHFEPLSGQEESAEVRRWTVSVLAPGEEMQFLPPNLGSSGLMDTEALAQTYLQVRLTGSYRDALQKDFSADAVLADIAAWRRLSKDAHRRWEEPDPAKRLSKDLAERLGKNTLVPALRAIEKRLGGQ